MRFFVPHLEQFMICVFETAFISLNYPLLKWQKTIGREASYVFYKKSEY
jgi:hypothetical protein